MIWNDMDRCVQFCIAQNLGRVCFHISKLSRPIGSYGQKTVDLWLNLPVYGMLNYLANLTTSLWNVKLPNLADLYRVVEC